VTDTYTKFRNEVMAGGADNPDLEPTAGGPTAFIAIAVLVGLLIALYSWSTWAFVFVVGLLISIFLHEVGHFITARWTGMKATQFFLFMGPKLWSFRRGETEYGLRMYPVGAFVRIIGMNNLDEVAPEDEARAYRNKSYPRRMLVITAGSLMHLIIAISLVFTVYSINGRRVETDRVGIGSVSTNYPAGQAGVKPCSGCRWKRAGVESGCGPRGGRMETAAMSGRPGIVDSGGQEVAGGADQQGKLGAFRLGGDGVARHRGGKAALRAERKPLGVDQRSRLPEPGVDLRQRLDL